MPHDRKETAVIGCRNAMNDRMHTLIIFQVISSHMKVQGIIKFSQHSLHLKIFLNGIQVKVHANINP